MEEDDRTEASRLAHPPQSRPADAEHIADLFLGQQAFFRPLGPLPELGGTPATGQNGLAVVEGQGLVQFQGGLDEAMDGGKHGTPFGEKCGFGKGRGLYEVPTVFSISEEFGMRFKLGLILTSVSEFRPIPTHSSDVNSSRSRSREDDQAG